MKLMFNKIFKNYFLLTTTLFLAEIIFRLVLGLTIVDWSVIRILIGVNFIGLICGFVFSFCGRIMGNILTFIVGLVFSVYSVAQAGFYNFVGTFMSFGTSSQLGAVTDYINDYFNSFSWTFWLIFVPVVALLIFYIFVDHKFHVMEMNHMIDFADKFDSLERKEMNEKANIKKKKKALLSDKIASVVFVCIFGGLYFATLIMPFMQNEFQLKSNKELLLNPDMPNIAVSQFGFVGYSLIDVRGTLFPSNEIIDNSFSEGYEIQEQVLSDFTRYIDDGVWKQIIADEANKNYLTLSNYYISQEITDKNDYTGIFEGKNLIVIMMESTNNIVLNEKYYPNLSKLYNEGWSWDNAYSPRNSCSTGNNEMSGMTSLYTINSSCTANIYKNNKYPQSLFGLFNEAGYNTSSYHNYTEQYYSRATIHPNMGSGHYYGVGELGIPYSNTYKEWPSDVELMNKMLELTKDEEQFMAWVTTVSAHQPYNQDSELSRKYFDLFSDTNYNTSLKRYMSKLKVFDDAIGALIEGLEKQGKLDDTVIVLYGDHYPYGLSNSTLNSYFDYDVSQRLEVDRTPFIIYNSKITPAKYDEYTSYMNIVPTIANLFGLDYDPRLYAGSDILSSTYNNRVVFADGSWQDSKAFYSATKGKITYFNDGDTYTADEIKGINAEVKNKISMSNLAIKTNYFEYLYSKFDEYKVATITNNTEESE